MARRGRNDIVIPDEIKAMSETELRAAMESHETSEEFDRLVQERDALNDKMRAITERNYCISAQLLNVINAKIKAKEDAGIEVEV